MRLHHPFGMTAGDGKLQSGRPRPPLATTQASTDLIGPTTPPRSRSLAVLGSPRTATGYARALHEMAAGCARGFRLELAKEGLDLSLAMLIPRADSSPTALPLSAQTRHHADAPTAAQSSRGRGSRDTPGMGKASLDPARARTSYSPGAGLSSQAQLASTCIGRTRRTACASPPLRMIALRDKPSPEVPSSSLAHCRCRTAWATPRRAAHRRPR
jgi:hypothetical protein